MHFLLAPKHCWTDLLKQCDTLACTLQKGHFFSGFVFHLMQNVYHKPGLPAAGHLIFADSAHSRFLPHASVKSREQTQSKFSLLQKASFVLFFFNKKTIFGNTFKILCSLSWIQAPAPNDGKPPLAPKSFTTPTRATSLTGPQRLLPAPWRFLYIGSVQTLSRVQLFSISWDAVCQVSLSITNSRSLLRLMFISAEPPNNFIFCLSALPSAFNLSLH